MNSIIRPPRPIVMTNGCFDILHRGHVELLKAAAAMGKSLIVAVNTDESIMRLKGPARPVNTLEDRMAVLAAIWCVTAVVPFSDDTPIALIREIQPDVLVKGGDWKKEDVAGALEVEQWGGVFRSVPITYHRSTTDIIEKIQRTKVLR